MRKFISLIIALALGFCFSVTSFAADGTAVIDFDTVYQSTQRDVGLSTALIAVLAAVAAVIVIAIISAAVIVSKHMKKISADLSGNNDEQ